MDTGDTRVRVSGVVLGAVALMIVGSHAPGVAFQVDAEAGQAAFVSGGCGRCHSVEVQGIEATIAVERMRGPDLSRVGDDHDAEGITSFVKRETSLEGVEHRVPYTGSDEDLLTLSEWLVELP